MSEETKKKALCLQHMVDETKKVMSRYVTNFSSTTVMQMCLDCEKQAHAVAESAYRDWSDEQ